MSHYKMLKNEQRNKRRAGLITAVIYIGMLGGLMAYSGGVQVSNYLPAVVKQWLPGQQDAPAVTPEKTPVKKPRA